MSTVQATNLKHGSSATNNIVLDASGNTTISGAATISGNAVVTGTLQANGVTGSVYPLVLGTAVASTSGTAIDFTGIPSWVRRITVMFRDVSTNGSSLIQVQLGSSAGFVTTGYVCQAWQSNTGNAAYNTGIVLGFNTGAAVANTGMMSIVSFGSNIFVGSGSVGRTNFGDTVVTNGSVSLPGALDRIRITTVGGTDTFDAGSINIQYE